MARLPFKRSLKSLRQDEDAVTVIEFALILPILLTLGGYGIEIANMASASMEVSQVALSLADNAARMQQTANTGVVPSVSNVDIASVLTGALKEGAGFNFQTQGKAIISSLERTASNQQIIQWQRCMGTYSASSAYGGQGTIISDPDGMGSGGANNKVKAKDSLTAIMYAEVFYQYRGIFGTLFVKPTQFKHEAAFMNRDVRNLHIMPIGTDSNLCT